MAQQRRCGYMYMVNALNLNKRSGLWNCVVFLGKTCAPIYFERVPANLVPGGGAGGGGGGGPCGASQPEGSGNTPSCFNATESGRSFGLMGHLARKQTFLLHIITLVVKDILGLGCLWKGDNMLYIICY